jgi:hypothetical protein
MKVTLDEREIEPVFERLTRLKAAIIDTSSIIYLQKAGFLQPVAGAIKLLTIPQVIEEIGHGGLPVEIISPPETTGGEKTDRILFASAMILHKPMISEDRAILLKCRERGVEYYNAYNMLIMLRLRNLRAEADFDRYEENLLAVAHYGKFVIDYIECLKQYLRKVI